MKGQGDFPAPTHFIALSGYLNEGALASPCSRRSGRGNPAFLASRLSPSRNFAAVHGLPPPARRNRTSALRERLSAPIVRAAAPAPAATPRAFRNRSYGGKLHRHLCRWQAEPGWLTKGFIAWRCARRSPAPVPGAPSDETFR